MAVGATTVGVQAVPTSAASAAAASGAASGAATYTPSATRRVASPDGDVLVRYPTSGGRMVAERPLVVVGHGHGMNPAVALDGNSYLVNAGYVVAVPPLGASTDFPALAEIVSRSLDAVLADRALAPAILDTRIGYTGASMGAITGVALLDPRTRDHRIDAVVIRSGSRAGLRPSWADAPPLLFVLGTADKVISPDRSRKAYERATYPKGKIELPGAGHDLTEPVRTPIVSNSTKAFFARFLDGDTDGLDGIRAAVQDDPNKPSYVSDWRLDRPGAAAAAPGYSYERSGRIAPGERRAAFRLEVTDSRLRARLSFRTAGVSDGAERAVMTLRDGHGTVVKRVRGDSVLRLRKGVDDGVYKLHVRKPNRHRDDALRYALDVTPAPAS
jgi:dienelactone hydrolase